MKRSIERINNNFDENFEKKTVHADHENLVFGSTVTYDTVSNSHVIVKNILKNSMTFENVKLPMTVPSVKLKRLLHTKKKFLKKLRN